MLSTEQAQHRPLRIAIDATNVKPGQGGIRTYALGVARNLARVEGLKVYVVVRQNDQEDWGDCEVVRSALKSEDPQVRIAWRELKLPAYISRLNVDLLFVPAPEALYRSPVPQAIVVHDVGPLVAPAVYGWPRFARYAATLRRACKRAEMVICVSESTRLDLARTVSPALSNLVVVGQGTQTSQITPADRRSARIGWTGDDSYSLYVGAALPHKNLQTLIRTYESVTEQMPKRLVLVGPEYGSEVKELMVSANTQTTEHRGFVSVSELTNLYAGASLLLFPSIHEGFGIPLVEAMQLGLPVVASRIPSLVEVGADAVTFVDRPLDPLDWRLRIEEICTDPSHARLLAKRGVERACDFTWDAQIADLVHRLRTISTSK